MNTDMGHAKDARQNIQPHLGQPGRGDWAIRLFNHR